MLYKFYLVLYAASSHPSTSSYRSLAIWISLFLKPIRLYPCLYLIYCIPVICMQVCSIFVVRFIELVFGFNFKGFNFWSIKAPYWLCIEAGSEVGTMKVIMPNILKQSLFFSSIHMAGITPTAFNSIWFSELVSVGN